MNLKPFTEFISRVANRFGVSYFFGLPADTITFWFLLAAFIAFFVIVFCLNMVFKFRARKQKPYLAYAKTFFWGNSTLILVAFVNLFARYESLAVLSWRFWMYLILAIAFAFNGWFFSIRTFQLNEQLIKLANKNRKDKWLKTGNKKKR